MWKSKSTKKGLTALTFLSSLLLTTILVTTFLIRTTKEDLQVQAAGEPLTISAPVTLSGNYYLSAPRFTDSTNGHSYYVDPSSSTTSATFAGNVGIGTTAPLSKLSVGGVGQANFSIYSVGTTVGMDGGVGVYSTSDEVGVYGVTTQTAAGGYGVLGVGGHTGVLGSGDTYGVSGSGVGSAIGGYFSSASGPALVTGTGNVGIGTTAPATQLAVSGTGQSVAALSDAGVQGATLHLLDNRNAVGAGGAILFGMQSTQTTGVQGVFAAIKGLETNGGSTAPNNHAQGDLVFSTRNSIADTALTERVRIYAGGGLSVNNGWFTTGHNTQTFPSSGSGMSIGWNHNIGNGETDFFNLYEAAAGSSFLFWQKTGTSTGTLLMAIDPAGAVGANTSITANAFDLAENVLVEDVSIESGDIVIAEATSNPPGWNQKYNAFIAAKAKTPYAQEAIGIISEKPGFLMRGYGLEEEDQIDQNRVRPLTLSGRVPVKISTVNGPIKIGDAITTSNISGVGMKATKAGYIIGRSLENYSNSDPNAVGKILVMVSISWYDPNAYLTNSDGLKIVTNSNNYSVKDKDNSVVSTIGAFAKLVVAKIQAGVIETKKLVVDGVDILKKLNELSSKVESQQKQIEELKRLIESK